jgi:hypothetical protein
MISQEDYDKIYPGDGMVNHLELRKHLNIEGLYSPFGLSIKDDKSWMGSYNYAPVGFREVILEEFAQARFDGSLLIHQHRQVFYQHDGTKLDKMVSADFTFYSGNCGYAIERNYWEKTVRYYLFEKCVHDWVHTRNLGKCYNEYKCEKCGTYNTVDSGD